MVKIYTKVGDHGYTKKVSGKMIPKYDLEIQALGAIDELDSWLGYVIATLSPKTSNMRAELMDVQRNLYELQADIIVKRHHNVTLDLVTHLEEKIDKMNVKLPVIKAFILPGGTQTGASLQYARALARRAERHTVELSNKQQELTVPILKYLNRLSDYLFILARYANFLEGYDEHRSKA